MGLGLVNVVHESVLWSGVRVYTMGVLKASFSNWLDRLQLHIRVCVDEA